MDSRELSEWVAYDSIEPIGDIRMDLVGGIISSTLANCHRGKNQSAFRPLDFMPIQKQGKEASKEDTIGQLLAFAATNKNVTHTHHEEEIEDGNSRNNPSKHKGTDSESAEGS